MWTIPLPSAHSLVENPFLYSIWFQLELAIDWLVLASVWPVPVLLLSIIQAFYFIACLFIIVTNDEKTSGWHQILPNPWICLNFTQLHPSFRCSVLPWYYRSIWLYWLGKTTQQINAFNNKTVNKIHPWSWLLMLHYEMENKKRCNDLMQSGKGWNQIQIYKMCLQKVW